MLCNASINICPLYNACVAAAVYKFTRSNVYNNKWLNILIYGKNMYNW